MPVDRCICEDVTLATLKAAADDLRASGALAECDLIGRIIDRCGGARMCGLCTPYIKLMLRTGRTEFDVLTCAEWDELQQSDDAAPTDPAIESA